MKHIHLFLAGIFMLALCGCSQEAFVDEPNGDVTSVRVIGPKDISFEGLATRGTEIIDGRTLIFSWSTEDTLGIFPNKGNQVEFPITSTGGGTSAVFDGGGWALRDGSSYAAYYPFSVWNYHRNNKTILLDYTGQVQEGNGSFAHLSAYDYLSSSRVTPENGQVTFEMSRLGAILYIDILVPEPTVVNSLVISCDEEIFTEKAALDLSGEEALATSTKMSNTLTLSFKNTVTTEANETVRGYMAVFPVDFSDKIVYATLKTEAGLFGAAVRSRAVDKASAAFLRFSDSFTSQSGEDNGHEYIEMAPGFYWATCNVGADNPWDYGDYFCWGETESRSFASNGFNDYKWRTSSGTYTKYVTDESSGTVDNLTTLLPDDDAAAANWLGNWRMPTDAEWTALRNPDDFTWKWTDNYNGSGVAGYTVTSKVPRYIGNQIFLPAAGVCSATFISKGSGGTYWSSSLNTGHSSTACNMDFWISESTGAQYIRNVDVRYDIKSVRPVYDLTPISSPEAVDLGLPSGLKWASCNLGASRPEEYGDYYAWGETEPYYSSQDPLTWKEGKESGYGWSSYNWCMGSENTLTKYCFDASYGYNGFTDTKTVLDLEDDAAHVNLGDKWRMPSDAEWTELRENCTWEWTSMNGINGRKITGPNGNSIFLPAAAIRHNTYLGLVGVEGVYWSSSLPLDAPGQAWLVLFVSDYVERNSKDRFGGKSIRPVYSEFISAESVSLSKASLTLTQGNQETLTATILPTNATEKTVIWISSDTSVATVSSDGVITAVSVGTATITAWASDGVHFATCNVTVKETSSIPVPEAVDLGLPSGLKWASCNLGASRPEEYGDYYAWGETEPYYSSQDPLIWKEGKESGYGWSSYNWCMGSENTITKYCSNFSYGYDGFTDTKTVLDLEDDAAHVNLGDKWRMPTNVEWSELLEKCTWTWTTQNGVYGLLVTANNGNSIFLPAAGRWANSSLGSDGGIGDYWSSSLYTDRPSFALCVYFFSGDVHYRNLGHRSLGFSVRPVSE